MEDNEILLRIRRQYTNDEKIKFLVQYIDTLLVEIGFLKSELSEAVDVNPEKDELKKFKLIHAELQKKHADTKRSLRQWQQKYIDLKQQTA